MKRKINFFAIACICAVGVLLFQSCIREEDYDQAILGDWELEEFERIKGETHYGGYCVGDDISHVIVLSGPHIVKVTNFETKCRISFREDGTYVTSEDADVESPKNYTIIGDLIDFSGSISWCPIAHWEDNSYAVYYTGEDRIIHFTDTSFTGKPRGWRNLTEIPMGQARDAHTIESLTRRKLTIVITDNEGGANVTYKFKRI